MCPLLAQSVKILDFQCGYFEIQILWMPKGGRAVIGALKILTLPKWGRGGLTHAKIFCGFVEVSQKPYLGIIQPK